MGSQEQRVHRRAAGGVGVDRKVSEYGNTPGFTGEPGSSGHSCRDDEITARSPALPGCSAKKRTIGR